MATRYAIRPAHLGFVALLICAAAFAAALAPPARANVGYELDSAHPSAPLTGLFARGLSVDQSTGDVYVAIMSTSLGSGAKGEILRFNSDLSADGTFAAGGGYYIGVAMNLVDGGFLAAQMELRIGSAGIGTSQLNRFNSSGASLGAFPLDYTNSLPPIAADSTGRIYLPNVTTHTVQVYSSAGAHVQEITCGDCPGGSFVNPASIALDSAGNLYVVDTNPDRVVKLVPSGGSFAFSTLFQSGRGAGGVAVDQGSGDVLVADLPGGHGFHVVAYDSSGTQFDDFGAGLFPDPPTASEYGALSTYQMAVNGNTHKLYVGSNDKFLAFEKTTIPSPSATVKPATSIGQQGATLNAKVNANGHAAIQCEFEYTAEGDFLINGFSAASHAPCSRSPDGTSEVALGGHAFGLSPSSVYRYRITVTNNGGTESSDDEAFETLPELPPLVTTEAAQSVAQSTAKIKASVNPRGGTVSVCRFELGTSVAYGTNLPCLTPSTGASTNVSETRSLTGLLPATTYHYRLVVTTNAGTAEGDDLEFTTANPPSEPEPEGGSSPDPTPAPAAAAPPPPTGQVVVPPATQCKKGFRRTRVNGKARCVKVCPKGFSRKLSRGKARCVRKKHAIRRRAGGSST